MSIPLIRNRGDGESYSYYHTTQEQVVSTADTDGAVTVLRVVDMPRDGAPPLHSHSREDESWVVLSGRVRFWVGAHSLDECEVHEVGPGGYVFGPRFVPHTFQPVTETAEVLVINNPGAIEGFFRSVGAADTRHDDEHVDLMARYGVTLFDKPPAS